MLNAGTLKKGAGFAVTNHLPVFPVYGSKSLRLYRYMEVFCLVYSEIVLYD